MARKSNAAKAAEEAAKTAEEAKVAENEPKAESIKAEEKKEEKKAASAKKESTKKTAAKTTASKTTAKTTAKTTSAKKAEKECSLQIQFGGKSYGQEDLMKIAKDVWKYDLKQKVGDLVSVELYVKPEESKVYYVMNGEFSGDFSI